MKTTTTTISTIVDQDRDAIKGKKINDTVLLGSCMSASERRRIFGRHFNSLHPKSNLSGAEKRRPRKCVYSRGFLCSKPKLFCKLLRCFPFSFFPFLGKG